jgi:hypothetical protein
MRSCTAVAGSGRQAPAPSTDPRLTSRSVLGDSQAVLALGRDQPVNGRPGRQRGRRDAFPGLFVLVALVGLAVSGSAAASGSVHRQGRMLALSAAQQVCPSNPIVPLVEPEARDVMNVDAAQQIADGTGVKVGIISDGIDVSSSTTGTSAGSAPAPQPTGGRRSAQRASSLRRDGRPMTSPPSSTPLIRCRRGATSRSRGSHPAPASQCSTRRAATLGR